MVYVHLLEYWMKKKKFQIFKVIKSWVENKYTAQQT